MDVEWPVVRIMFFTVSSAFSLYRTLILLLLCLASSQLFCQKPYYYYRNNKFMF